jgi:hypothetical protein
MLSAYQRAKSIDRFQSLPLYGSSRALGARLDALAIENMMDGTVYGAVAHSGSGSWSRSSFDP